MERTLVSWNVPNLITINLMAWIGFLVIVAIFQMVAARKGRPQTAVGTNGATEIADLGY